MYTQYKCCLRTTPDYTSQLCFAHYYNTYTYIYASYCVLCTCMHTLLVSVVYRPAEILEPVQSQLQGMRVQQISQLPTPVPQFLGDFLTKVHCHFAVCGVQIEI